MRGWCEEDDARADGRDPVEIDDDFKTPDDVTGPEMNAISTTKTGALALVLDLGPTFGDQRRTISSWTASSPCWRMQTKHCSWRTQQPPSQSHQCGDQEGEHHHPTSSFSSSCFALLSLALLCFALDVVQARCSNTGLSFDL